MLRCLPLTPYEFLGFILLFLHNMEAILVSCSPVTSGSLHFCLSCQDRLAHTTQPNYVCCNAVPEPFTKFTANFLFHVFTFPDFSVSLITFIHLVSFSSLGSKNTIHFPLILKKCLIIKAAKEIDLEKDLA